MSRILLNINIIKKIKKDYKKYKKNMKYERYQNLSKKEKEKRGNMIVNFTEVSQKMKKKSLLSIDLKSFFDE